MTGWQWHPLDHMQIICTLLQTDNHTSTLPVSFYRPDALPADQTTSSKHSRLSYFRKSCDKTNSQKKFGPSWRGEMILIFG